MRSEGVPTLGNDRHSGISATKTLLASNPENLGLLLYRTIHPDTGVDTRPVGLAAMITAKTLGLPFQAVYHTHIPEFVGKVTDDPFNWKRCAGSTVSGSMTLRM